MKKRSSFCLLYMERASAPTAEKERLIGIGWRSLSDMDGAADDMLFMEELLVYAILLYEGLVTENEYNKRLDELFLTTPENDDLLYLEWETDISKAIIYVRTHIDYKNLNLEQFGRILMSKLKVVYKNCPDIKYFASQMYRLWESLPGNIQNIEPFWTLCYADDPLAWGDEKQTRDIYEHMLRYYEGSNSLLRSGIMK